VALSDPFPAGHDLHPFSHVLHDWGEQQVRELFAASFAALAPGGWLIDHDTHLNAEKTGPLPVAEYSVFLMHATPGTCWAVDELKGFLERERGKGVYLSVLGVGRGNYNDALMQALAQNGNGVAAYIDTINEARKVLVEEASSTLFPIAKDVKIQIEFNPATVAEYRLIGYETRLLNRDDFNNDKVDAGDVGSGQTVTALYEIVPVGGPSVVDDLRYAPKDAASGAKPQNASEYAFVKIRYKLPNSDVSKLITTPVDASAETARFADAPEDARFAASVAAFGELPRGGRYTGNFGYDDVLKIAIGARGDDPFGYRSEFVQLVRAAKTASALPATEP